MSEEMIVRHCSPTLAGIKTGNLFSCNYESAETLRDEIRRLNRILTPRGVRILPVKISDNRALIYLYRPAMLSRDLSDREASCMLISHGYLCLHADKCVVELIKKLKDSVEFPHEIGLFLGYPPEDVKGFIENKGEHCKCAGYWKVYSDESRACSLFKKYKKCTDIYCQKCAEGISIKRLTVAG